MFDYFKLHLWFFIYRLGKWVESRMRNNMSNHRTLPYITSMVGWTCLIMLNQGSQKDTITSKKNKNMRYNHVLYIQCMLILWNIHHWYMMMELRKVMILDYSTFKYPHDYMVHVEKDITFFPQCKHNLFRGYKKPSTFLFSSLNRHVEDCFKRLRKSSISS